MKAKILIAFLAAMASAFNFHLMANQAKALPAEMESLPVCAACAEYTEPESYSEPYVAPPYSQSDAVMLARTVWGEARGCSKTEQAAVAWCVLNRVDSDSFPNTIAEVVTAPHQFDGYQQSHPVTDEQMWIAVDVLERWYGDGEGRVLPEEYLFFTGDGKENHFTIGWKDNKEWDWSLTSPYEEE